MPRPCTDAGIVSSPGRGPCVGVVAPARVPDTDSSLPHPARTDAGLVAPAPSGFVPVRAEPLSPPPRHASLMQNYLLMFAVSFLSATLLPAQSEAVLVALVAQGEQSPWTLLATATLGNTLGSATNWLLGLFAHRFMHSRWFPATPERLEKARNWYHRYGRWSLLLSWLPVMGDALTLAAGVMREPFASFFLITLTAKFLRYLVLIGVYLALF